MKRLLRPSLVLASTAVALLGGGAVLAYAGWTSRSTSATFTVTAAKVPQVPRPTVSLAPVPVVSWERVRITPNTPVHRYVVTRHVGTDARVVCRLSARSFTRCVDLTAPIGSPLTYTVRATHGRHWAGVDSEPSLPLGATDALPTLDPSGIPIAPTTATPTMPLPSADGVGPLQVRPSPTAEPTTSGVQVQPTIDEPITESPATPDGSAPPT